MGTWQRQLKGQIEYELSRRILVTIYKYRDSINNLRTPMMFGHEMPSPPDDEAKTMNQNQVHFFGMSEAYKVRWDKVQKEKVSLYADLLEAEAIWGTDLSTLFKKVNNLEHELLIRIRRYLDLCNPDISKASKKAIIEIYKKRRDIMYDLSKDLDNPDEFKMDFSLAIEEIEKYLKPKLIY